MKGKKIKLGLSILAVVIRRVYERGDCIMRFLSIYKCVETNGPLTGEEITRMEALIEEGMKSGHLLATEGCLPSVLGARIRLIDGELKVTDGPFTESKEVIGGFALLQASSKEEAIQFAKQFLQVVGGEGECELRQVSETAACAA
jgi:hypothetical protein